MFHICILNHPKISFFCFLASVLLGCSQVLSDVGGHGCIHKLFFLSL